jgi:hypothetical protein
MSIVSAGKFTNEQLTQRHLSGRSLGFYITEIEAYIRRASIPLEKLNGLPACPFAMDEMLKDRIDYGVIYFKEQEQGIVNALAKMYEFDKDSSKQTLVLIADDIERIALDKGTELAAKITECYRRKHGSKDIVAIISNPAENKHTYVHLPPFIFFLIQYVSDLDRGIEWLRNKGYYKNLKDDEIVTDDSGTWKSLVLQNMTSK